LPRARHQSWRQLTSAAHEVSNAGLGWHGLETHLMHGILQLPFPLVKLLDGPFELGLVRAAGAGGALNAFHVLCWGAEEQFGSQVLLQDTESAVGGNLSFVTRYKDPGTKIEQEGCV